VIDVVRDTEGVRMALEEIFEEDYARSHITREIDGASDETLQRMEARMPVRTLSPGYYAYGGHLLRLEQLQKAGIEFRAGELPGFECDGLLALGRARAGFEQKHPPCGACGAHLQNRFTVKCHACGTTFKPR
jgi:hypothetical protein